MHSPGAPHGSPSNGAVLRPGVLEPDIQIWESVSAKPTRKVLSVGRMEADPLLRRALLECPQFCFSFANDYRELWMFSKRSDVYIVLINNSLCSFELAEAARLVRHCWPSAKILIIRSGDVCLERSLYDQRLTPAASPKLVLSTLKQLAKRSNEGDIQNGDR